MPPAATTQAFDERADIGILTVISAELEAALSAFPPLARIKDPKTGTIFRTGTIHSELTNHDYRVVLSCIGEPGNPPAAAAATELLLKYEPRAVLLMGIAGGMRGKTMIGDVALSERVVAYEPAALTRASDGRTQVEHRPDIDRTPHSMMQDVVDYISRLDAQRLEVSFRKMDGRFPTPPLGEEEQYTKNVASAVRPKLSTIGAGEKLLRNPDEIKSLNRDIHGKLHVVAMEESGLVNAARRFNVPWLVVRGISDFGDEFKNDSFHLFASKTAAAVLVDFIIHGIDVGPPPPPAGWRAAEVATELWREETRDVIGKDVRIPRDELQDRVVASIENERVTVLLGDSGSGKSALLKAIYNAGALPGEALCLPAQEATDLIRSYDLDAIIRAKRKGERSLLIIDGLDRAAGSEALRLIARLLRALDLVSEASPWRLLLTCQPALWDRCRQEMIALNVPLAVAKSIWIPPFNTSEVAQIAQEVRDIAPALLRDELSPVMGCPKILDLVACAAADVGLPDVAQWVGESSLVEWTWEKFFCGGDRDVRHSGLLQDVAMRQADERRFAIPITEVSAPERALVDDLARVGVIIKRHDTIRFAHDLYADYARQRYLLALVSAHRLEELRSRLTNPLWHRAIRLVSLHLLEYRDADRTPDVDGWRRLVHALDERIGVMTSAEGEDPRREGPPPGAGVDLLLEGVAFAAQPGALLDTIINDLVADRGALLRSFLFRFKQAAIEWVPLRDLIKRPSGDVAPQPEERLNQIVHLPNYPLWSRVIEWMAAHAQQVISLAPWEFLDGAEYWLETTLVFLEKTLFEVKAAQVLARLVVDLAERMNATGYHCSRHSEFGKQCVSLCRLMLLCGLYESERVHALIRTLSGLDTDAVPRRRFARSSILPPDYIPRVKKPAFWPRGPISEPAEHFREAALTMPGAEWIVEMGPAFASDVFLALLIELPDPDRDADMVSDRGGFAFDSWHHVRPPFWSFPPAQCLLSKNPEIGIDFVIQVADFATDRWAEHWPHVVRTGTIFDEVQVEVPRLVLIIDGTSREYVGDARALEWHQGGSQGPDAVAAPLMALEHWLYAQDDAHKLDGATLTDILRKTHSVAVVGVLFDLAMKNPAHLIGPLEPFVASPELYLWGRLRGMGIQVHAQTAMVSWIGEVQDRVKGAHEWHTMPHRGRDFLTIVTRLLLQRDFDWPMLDEARRSWAEAASQNSSQRLSEWIQDVLLPGLDKNNWRSTMQQDGRRLAEYAHPEQIVQRQLEARRLIEEGAARRYFPLRCRRILTGDEVIDEDKLVELLNFAAQPMDMWTEEETCLMGGAWTPRCGAAAVAILKFDDWLMTNPDWQARCKLWITEACGAAPHSLRCDPSYSDTDWDSFCADALPLLWERMPEDRTLGRCIAHLVAAPHQDARRRVFVVLAQRRAEYPEGFARLQHLSIWCARLAMLDPGPVPGLEGLSVDECFSRLVEDFVCKKLSPIPPNWVEVFDARPEALGANPYGEWDGFEDRTLLLSFAWLAGEASGYSKAHDREFLRVLVEGLASVVPRRLLHAREKEQPWRVPVTYPGSLQVPACQGEFAIGQPAQESEFKCGIGTYITRAKTTATRILSHICTVVRVARAREPPALPVSPQRRLHTITTPYESDYKIAELVGLFLVHEPDTANRRRIWEPWFALQGPCHHWVDLLLSYAYLAAANVDERTSQFPALMHDMFEHALAEGGWLDGQSRSSGGRLEVGRAFLGFGSLAHGEFWAAERAPTAISLRAYWPRWVDVAMTWLWCARAFTRMLRKPAFAPLRPSCLHWLVRVPPARWMTEDDDEAPVALVRLLELVWQERSEEGHELAGPLRDVFEQLLRELVARHEPDAVQLSARVGRNK